MSSSKYQILHQISRDYTMIKLMSRIHLDLHFAGVLMAFSFFLRSLISPTGCLHSDAPYSKKTRARIIFNRSKSSLEGASVAFPSSHYLHWTLVHLPIYLHWNQAGMWRNVRFHLCIPFQKWPSECSFLYRLMLSLDCYWHKNYVVQNSAMALAYIPGEKVNFPLAPFWLPCNKSRREGPGDR